VNKAQKTKSKRDASPDDSKPEWLDYWNAIPIGGSLPHTVAKHFVM